VRACSQRSSLAIYISQRNPLGRVCNSHFPEKPTGKGFATEFPEKLTGKGFAIEFPVDSFGKCGKCTVPRDKHWEQGKNEIPSGSHWDGYASPLGKALTPPPCPSESHWETEQILTWAEAVSQREALGTLPKTVSQWSSLGSGNLYENVQLPGPLNNFDLNA
jgi:hypothetical protein